MSYLNTLQAQGFNLIPTTSKRTPAVENWPNLTGGKRLSVDDIKQKGKGVGVITGQPLGDGFICALDIDVYSVKLSKEIKDRLAKLLHPLPIRVGQAPKFLVPFLCDEQLTKITSFKFVNQNHQEARIEVLGKGQYFNALGPHERGHGGKYTWLGCKLAVDNLPRMNVNAVKDFIAWFEEVVPRRGFERVGPSAEVRDVKEHFKPGDDFMAEIAKPPLDLDATEIRRQLWAIECPGMPHDEWAAVGMALHHQFNGEPKGLRLWLDWSAQDKGECNEQPGKPRFDPDLIRRKWASFGGRGQQALTWASMIYRYELDDPQPKPDADTPHKVNIDPAQYFSGGMDFQNGFTFADFLIRKLIPSSGLGVIYGASGIMKSFWALLAAYSVATGKGLKTIKQHKVVYFDGENGTALKLRLKALHEDLKGNEALVQRNMFFQSSALRLTDPKVYAEYINTMRAIGPALVVIDTLSEARGELDENSATDMQKLINVAKRLSKDLDDCVVLFVHHSGKGDSKALRGSSVIEASCDFVLRAERAESDEGKRLIKVVTQKQRQGEQGLEFVYEAHSYDSGMVDGYGDPVTTLFLREADADLVSVKKVVRRGKNQLALIKAYKLLESVGDVVDVPDRIILENGWDAAAQGVRNEDLMARYAEMQNAELDHNLRKRYSEARLSLINDGTFASFDSVVVMLSCNT